MMVQQARPGAGSVRNRKMLMDCDMAGPQRCVNTKFRAMLRSARSIRAEFGINQSITLMILS